MTDQPRTPSLRKNYDTWKIFILLLLLVLIYTALYTIDDAEKKYCENSVRKLAYGFNTKKYSLFMLIVLVLYTTLYSASKRLGWEHEEKQYTHHYEHIVVLLAFSTIIYTFANMSNTFNMYTLIGMILGSYGIAYIGSLPGFNFSMQSVDRISKIPMATVLSFVTILAASTIFTYKKYAQCEFKTYFWIFLLAPIFILAASYITLYYQLKQESKKPEQERRKVELHLHHWQWSIPLIFLFRFPNDTVSSLLSGVLFGIFADGVIRYGPDSIYSYT